MANLNVSGTKPALTTESETFGIAATPPPTQSATFDAKAVTLPAAEGDTARVVAKRRRSKFTPLSVAMKELVGLLPTTGQTMVDACLTVDNIRQTPVSTIKLLAKCYEIRFGTVHPLLQDRARMGRKPTIREQLRRTIGNPLQFLTSTEVSR